MAHADIHTYRVSHNLDSIPRTGSNAQSAPVAPVDINHCCHVRVRSVACSTLIAYSLFLLVAQRLDLRVDRVERILQ